MGMVPGLAWRLPRLLTDKSKRSKQWVLPRGSRWQLVQLRLELSRGLSLLPHARLQVLRPWLPPCPLPVTAFFIPAHSLVLSQRTEMLRKGGQKERRGTSLGKDLTNDNIEEKMGIPVKPVAELWKKEHISRTGIAQKRTVIEKKRDQVIYHTKVCTLKHIHMVGSINAHRQMTKRIIEPDI